MKFDYFKEKCDWWDTTGFYMESTDPQDATTDSARTVFEITTASNTVAESTTDPISTATDTLLQTTTAGGWTLRPLLSPLIISFTIYLLYYLVASATL